MNPKASPERISQHLARVVANHYQPLMSQQSRFSRNFAAEALEDRIAPAILIGLTSKDLLISFDSAKPSAILTSAIITGLADGENIVSLDSRPANGLAYAPAPKWLFGAPCARACGRDDAYRSLS